MVRKPATGETNQQISSIEVKGTVAVNVLP